MKHLLTLIGFFVVFVSLGQESKSILILNGRLHVGNGEVIESAAIGIKQGKIEFVKNSLAFTYDANEWDTIVDATRQEIYPGFVAPNSTLGITEIDAVRATNDFNDVGVYNPHVRAQIAFNVESKIISTVRTNGVLISQATPRGGIISGSSAVMGLDGWNWEDATIQKDDGIHLNWPSSMQGGGWWAEPSQKKRNEKYDEQRREIIEFFQLAKAYAQANNSNNPDLRLEAMRDCFEGKKRVYIHADELQEITDVIEFSIDLGLKFPVIVGGYDAHLVGRRLKDANIPVMVIRPHSLPENEDDALDHPFELPVLLRKEGVKFCIQNEGDMEAMNARNIPFLAGTAMAYGLSEEEAISSISLWSCQILGIDNQYGSIEKGKSATLFISKGNALDMRSNAVTTGMIDGNFISKSNFQNDLYEKYLEKYKN